jgi:two-component system cell cycle sensor histidine kinase/response regulator CckA
MYTGEAKTVLLVDDDALVRDFTALCLSKAGFNVIEAANAEVALEIFEARQEEIDLVLTDMVMPGLFGDQLALRLWEIQPKMPIIFISGNPPEALEPGIELEPFKNFLRKPFTVEDLLQTIRCKLEGVERS